MKTLTTLALALTFAATACATEDTSDSRIEVRHTGDVVEGTLTENGVSIEFTLEHGSRLVIGTRDHYKLVDSARISADTFAEIEGTPELEVMRDLPGALAAKGIDINALVNASPALGQILCPTRTAFDPITQTDNLDLARN